MYILILYFAFTFLFKSYVFSILPFFFQLNDLKELSKVGHPKMIYKLICVKKYLGYYQNLAIVC